MTRGTIVALREMRRVLQPGGRMLFVEHGQAPDGGVARWQDRLTPCCHLNREIDDLIAGRGFHIEPVETGYMRARTPFSYMYKGVARPGH